MKSNQIFFFKFAILLVVLVMVIQPVISASSQALPVQVSSVNAAADYPVTKNPMTADVRVRQAIAFCTDRRALAQAAFPTYTDPQIDALMMDSFLPSTHWAYSQPTSLYPFNPSQGQALLDQVGWTLQPGDTYRTNSAGAPLVFKLTTGESAVRYAWAPVFEQQMLNCGIQFLTFYTPGGWLFGTQTGVTRRDFEISGFAWTIDVDQDIVNLFGCSSIPSAQNGWQGLNFMGWCNQTASQAAAQAGNTGLTHDQRLPYFAILQNQFATDMPSLPLFLYDAGGTNYEHIDFNFDNPPPPTIVLLDLKVRQAIAYCTDRQALAKAAYPTYTDPQIDALMMDSFLPSTHWAYSKPTAQYPFDPAQGQALLDQAGWTLQPSATYRTNSVGDPLVFKMTTGESAIRYLWPPVFEQQMLNCGIQVLTFHTPNTWLFGTKTGINRRDFEIGAFAWALDADQDIVNLFGCNSIPSFSNGWQGLNFMGWCNQAASQAAAQAANTVLTHDQRLPYFTILQNQFANDMPSLPLFLYDPSGTTYEHIDFNQVPPNWPIFLPMIGKK